jgi:hypothetical protein
MVYFYGIHVEVKYLGPTNHRGSRYKATIDRGGNHKFSATVNYDYALDSYDNQLKAVEEVARKFLDQNPYYDGFKVLAATVGNFIIELTSNDEVAA